MSDMEERNFANVTHYTQVDVQPGGVNIQHVEHLYQADLLKALGVKLVAKRVDEPANDSVACENPSPLNTPEAHELWQLAIRHGWVNDKLQPLVSQPKAAILASVMADVLDLSPRWAYFEQMWGIVDLPTNLCKAQNCGYYSTFIKQVETVLM